MSMYDMLNGMNKATFFILPMLGKHPDEYPRFRDCFVEDGTIAVYTRVGGDNRGYGFGEEELYKHPNFLYTEDDDFDSTYATYYFNVPPEFEADFNLIMEDKMQEVSQAYKHQLYKIYPKLTEQFDKVFGKGGE